MAQAVAASGEQAAKGVDKIGSGSDVAAQRLDKATSSIVGSVQRATAAMQAGERGSAKYFETLASQRGADLGVLKPYLDQLRQVEAAQKPQADRSAISARPRNKQPQPCVACRPSSRTSSPACRADRPRSPFSCSRADSSRICSAALAMQPRHWAAT